MEFSMDKINTNIFRGPCIFKDDAIYNRAYNFIKARLISLDNEK